MAPAAPSCEVDAHRELVDTEESVASQSLVESMAGLSA